MQWGIHKDPLRDGALQKRLSMNLRAGAAAARRELGCPRAHQLRGPICRVRGPEAAMCKLLRLCITREIRLFPDDKLSPPLCDFLLSILLKPAESLRQLGST